MTETIFLTEISSKNMTRAFLKLINLLNLELLKLSSINLLKKQKLLN